MSWRRIPGPAPSFASRCAFSTRSPASMAMSASRLKIISGRDGQDAGVVFRAADPNNYYLVRASARDHNICMFRVMDARIEPVPRERRPPGTIGVLHPIRIGDWNLLRVTYKGNQTTVYFNHRKVFDAFDGALNTAGRAGVWTKADTVAYFDDFRIDKKR